MRGDQVICGDPVEPTAERVERVTSNGLFASADAGVVLQWDAAAPSPTTGVSMLGGWFTIDGVAVGFDYPAEHPFAEVE